MGEFDLVKKRIHYARTIFGEFQLLHDTFLAEHPYTLEARNLPHSSSHRGVYFRITNADLLSLSFRGADVVSNLGSCIDNSLAAMWRANPGKKQRVPSFPQCKTKDSYAQWVSSHWSNISIENYNALDKLMPYNKAVADPKFANTGPTHPLIVIKDLWSPDKHYVPLSFNFQKKISFTVGKSPIGLVGYDRLVDDTLILVIPPSTKFPEDISILDLKIYFDTPMRTRGLPDVIQTMTWLLEYMEGEFVAVLDPVLA